MGGLPDALFVIDTNKEHIAFCGYHGWHDWFISNTNLNKGIPR